MDLKNKIGVVTVTYNSADVLDNFLESIKNQTYKNYILYVIDNASHDKTSEMIIAEHNPRIVYIQNDSNIGVAAGNNQGILKAIQDRCSHILLLNNDTLFESELFEKLLVGLEENEADMVVPKMYYFDKQNTIWFAGGNFDKTFQCDVNHIGFKKDDNGQYDKISEITYAPTCCMLIKKEVFDVVGLMDEKYFVYEDDVDFCYRAILINKKKMVYLPSFKFYHKVEGLTNKERSLFMSDFSIHMITRNKIYMCKKFFTWKKIFYIFLMFARENLKLLLQRKYKRSLHSLILLNKSFLEGLFYR